MIAAGFASGNLSKRIDKIEKLRVRTTDRNATQAEEDTAAMMIGRELMRHPDLAVVVNGHQSRPRSEARTEPRGDSVMLHDVLVVRQTSKAWLVRSPAISKAIWLPKSQAAIDHSDNSITIPRWLWEKVNSDQ